MTYTWTLGLCVISDAGAKPIEQEHLWKGDR